MAAAPMAKKASARKPAGLNFEVCKRNTLGKLDKSPKGSLDPPIEALVHKINAHRDFCTTSSCSGRVSLYASAVPAAVQGGGAAASCTPVSGKWLLVIHRELEEGELQAALAPEALSQAHARGLEHVLLKVEPAILHVQCRSLDDATSLLQLAIASGFRESGIVLSSSQKVMLAIRTTSNAMELPIVRDGTLLASAHHVDVLFDEANKRFRANARALARLEGAFDQHALASATTSTRSTSEVHQVSLAHSHPSGEVQRAGATPWTVCCRWTASASYLWRIWWSALCLLVEHALCLGFEALDLSRAAVSFA